MNLVIKSEVNFVELKHSQVATTFLFKLYMERTLLSTLKGGNTFSIKSEICKWCSFILCLRTIHHLNDSNISGWLPILKIDFNTCDHNKAVIQYIYICILCYLPFSIDKEIPNKQIIIKQVFNTSSSAAITAMLINKEVLTY